jgi:tetratricopeptide (TPR) repeat protein
MFSWMRVVSAALLSLLFCCFVVSLSSAQSNEQVEIGPPPLHRAEPPAPSATPDELEVQGDSLRLQKDFLDAIEYYQTALKGAPANASLANKMGICYLMMGRYREAHKNFERAIKVDHNHADAYNNLGVTFYATHSYNAAIKQYEKAIALKDDAASYYSNLGTAYFGKHEFERAIESYSKAMQIDPDIFDTSSHAGVQAKLPSPEDRAHYDYVLAKMFAKQGVNDRSLHYLKKAMEEGYANIKNVYKDSEFGTLRKDPRFAELMTSGTLAIPD